MKKILVGVDGSPSQVKVLAEAAALAKKLEAELVVFRAVSLPVELPQAAYSVRPDQVAEIVLADARRAVDELVASVQGRVRARVELGTSWRQILDAAKAEKADLVVIGSHGYGGLDRLLGTTAGKVVNHADRSVLVIRPDGPMPV
jgi:nucleotide-binding universal stress UspA family protein